MKRQVLFVDDEPMILEGLKRTLRGLRDEWDMYFVGSAEKALSLMEERQVSVVVSDMRMPGLNGAQLMNLLMERHPGTVRLILSGYADRDLILSCVQSAHQCLPKPCDPETLLTAINRAEELEESRKNQNLQSLISQLQTVPSLPPLYGEIVDRTNDPNTTLVEVAEIISKDPGMTAKILKLVNSAFFGLRRDIANMQEATSYLGIEAIKSLVLTVNAFSQFEGRQREAIPIGEIWSHSLLVGSGAKLIAKTESCPTSVQERCFVAGVLHDIGKLVLAVNFSDEYLELLRTIKSGNALCGAERARFGADHAEIGGVLLGLWGLPGAVVDAIALHHRPCASPVKHFTALTAVHSANAFAHGLEDQISKEPYLSELQLRDRLGVWSDALRNDMPYSPPTGESSREALAPRGKSLFFDDLSRARQRRCCAT